MAMKIERGGVTIIVETKDDLIAALQAIDELNSPSKTTDSKNGTAHARTPASGQTQQAGFGLSGPGPRVDCAGKTIVQCAAEILASRGNRPMHHQEISRIAIEGGYSSGRPTDDPASAAQRSFEQTLRRLPDQFEPLGNGRFRLVPSSPEDRPAE